MDWPEIRLKSKFGIIQIQLIKISAIKKRGWSQYKLTRFKKECIALSLARLDRARELELYRKLEGVALSNKERFEPCMKVYKTYKSLSDTELIMTVINYPKQDFYLLMNIA